jgi:hypothetical protein
MARRRPAIMSKDHADTQSSSSSRKATMKIFIYYRQPTYHRNYYVEEEVSMSGEFEQETATYIHINQATDGSYNHTKIPWANIIYVGWSE